MGTKQSKAKQEEERLFEERDIREEERDTLIDQCWQRLIEVESININVLSLEELKELCHTLEIEMSELDSKKASKLPGEIRSRFKQQYLNIIQGYKDIMGEPDSVNKLIDELTKLKAPIHETEATFEKQISAAKQEWEELKSNQTIHSYLKQTIHSYLMQTIETELKRLDKEVIDQLLSRMPQEILDSIKYPTSVKECRNIVRCYELIPELRKMKAPINKSQETTFERQITTARQELEELNSNETIEYYHRRDLTLKIETELKRLIKEFINQLQLPQEIRDSIKEKYITNFNECRDIVRYYELIPELTKMKAPINKSQETTFEKQISTARQELEELKSNKTIDSYHKRDLILKIETEFKRLDKEVTDQFLNVEVRDSIDLIEKTLAEPHLYSLPHLIMWRNTAQEKIQKIKNFGKLIPQKIVTEKIEKYESLIIQLRAEILKLRTYPIPEPWGSHCMRVELTYLMKGEFVFFVHPGIEEDMRPLKLSDRDILPGGLTRQEYDSRMNRMKRESTTAIEELKAKNAEDMERKLKWFEDSFAEIEKDVNFAFTELPLLYRDGRSLEYLIDKNQDDELLQEIHDTLLRRIRHLYNNRINIPSVDIDYWNDPLLIPPPKAERDIPIASGVDRGATEGLQLVTPASVVVYKNTVFVADKYGHSISYYRDRDLEANGSYHHTTADTPVSITIFNDSLYACYSNELVKFSLSWGKKYVESIQFKTSIQIPQICCTTSDYGLFVGTLKPSLIHINTNSHQIAKEYPLNPISYHTNKKNRYPWLQDIKATGNSIFCLFTGSPSPLQEFSLMGVLRSSVLTEDKIVGAYHFNVFENPVTGEWRIYIADFWDSAIKVFDMEGQFIETFSEKGFGLGQIIQPTGIFVEESGFITVCDMKEDNCLQRL